MKPDNTPTSKLDHVRLAYELGFLPLAVTKTQRKPNKQQQEWLTTLERPTLSELLEPFEKSPSRNIAVPLGAYSNGIVAIDFEELESYQNWSSNNPETALLLPTVATETGRQIYFRNTEQLIRSTDLREYGLIGRMIGTGDTAFYPSSVVGDHEYRWLISPNTETGVPLLSFSEIGLFSDSVVKSILGSELEPENISQDSVCFPRARIGTEPYTALRNTTEPNTTLRNTTDSHPIPTYSQWSTTHSEFVSDKPASSDPLAFINDYPSFTAGDVNDTLWRLACRSVNELTKEVAEARCEDVFAKWWELYGEGDEEEESRRSTEFLCMVFRTNESESFLKQLGEGYESEPLPKYADKIPKTPRFRLLAQLLAFADRLTDGDTFFLSMEEINERCGFKSKRAVSSAIYLLTTKKILEIVERGNRRLANRYRLLLNPDGTVRPTKPLAHESKVDKSRTSVTS